MFWKWLRLSGIWEVCICTVLSWSDSDFLDVNPANFLGTISQNFIFLYRFFIRLLLKRYFLFLFVRRRSFRGLIWSFNSVRPIWWDNLLWNLDLLYGHFRWCDSFYLLVLVWPPWLQNSALWLLLLHILWTKIKGNLNTGHAVNIADWSRVIGLLL